jgi:phosphoglycerol transferase MdoB-like AlkP superfamily enzyme
MLVRAAVPLYACTTLGRLLLWLWQKDRLADLDLGTQLQAFLVGLRMDTMAIAWLLSPMLLILCWAPSKAAVVGAQSIRIWMLGCVLLTLFVEVSTFPFFAEYDVRPNYLYTAYLEYPVEVATMVWADQKAGLAIAGLMMLGTYWAYRRKQPLSGLEQVIGMRWRSRALLFLPLAAVLFLGIRSSFGHRGANTSDAMYCHNRVAGEVAKNSMYSAAYEAYRARNDDQRIAKQYGRMDPDEALSRVAAMLGTSLDPDRPLRRLERTVAPTQRPRNLVIIIQESMGARFVGHLGDTRQLTPQLDVLAQQSLVFTNLHSNGTRSIRGLCGLSAGFLAMPGEGELKRPKAQSDFFTVAALLKPHGYHTSFIYGGEARFDNMRGWYMGNGFDLVIEEKDYVAPSFRGSWGVSDEDLMQKANETYRDLHARGVPFASVVFSSSNHTPFDLPEHKFEPVPGVPARSVENAIRYADYAIGRFFEAARQESYHAETIYLIAADHDIRVYGDSAVPVDAFHIPGMVHGACITAGSHTEVATQPDLLATAVSYLGMDLEHPMFGTPISKPGRQAFALMQFNESYGFRRGEKVAVLRPGMQPSTYLYKDRLLWPAESDPELERDGLALTHATEDLYSRKLYR